MCIENAERFRGSPKKVVTVWKVCNLHKGKLYSLFYGFTPHPIGRWAKAKDDGSWDAGWHAYGSRASAIQMSGNSGTIVCCRMRDIRFRNEQGDVIARWMYIPKSELQRVIREVGVGGRETLAGVG